MYVINTLKHNSFKDVDIPKPAELYKKYGFGIGTQKASGDQYLDPAENKVDMAQNVQKEVDALEKEEDKKDE